MTTETTTAQPRIPLNRERVLRAAVAYADGNGIDSLSMRKLGQELGVEAMSLYNHVKNKEDLLNGMVDTVLAEIDLSPGGSDWKSCLRHRILSARSALINHPWASQVIESRKDMSPAMIGYFDGIVGILRDGGFSLDLIHHAMHALGSRMLGFSQELFDESDDKSDDPEAAAMMMQMLERYPNISAMLQEISHDPDDPVVGSGCDDQTEFVFGLDLILDGLERLRLAEV
ncbi:MAG: TetR/AcrR family transcriptional regulator C-terminal domain-containing protein [Acidimicrobiia bacterium]|nr:TetR/AcrR family transcriptional regulator C-terminal domain-containing protein [Acidimicrobiia bacterium]